MTEKVNPGKKRLEFEIHVSGNRPLSSYLAPLFQSESSCKTFNMTMSLN